MKLEWTEQAGDFIRARHPKGFWLDICESDDFGDWAIIASDSSLLSYETDEDGNYTVLDQFCGAHSTLEQAKAAAFFVTPFWTNLANAFFHVKTKIRGHPFEKWEEYSVAIEMYKAEDWDDAVARLNASCTDCIVEPFVSTLTTHGWKKQTLLKFCTVINLL